MTTNDLDQAREWASTVNHYDDTYSRDENAAARVIASLPDEWIDADKLREALDWLDRKPSGDDYEAEFHDRLRALLPTPQPRTLADMTPEERKACQWMQADFDGEVVLLTRVSPNQVVFLHQSGIPGIRSSSWFHRITPLPDLRRMEWPEEEAPEPASTRPEDVPDGELWLVEVDGQQDAARRELPGTEHPWWLMREWRVSDRDITLVSRLVPEQA